ncbi:MAG: alternative ribosome rescue aminoacyl-tRNA hydrolase ArfB [Gemmatimonadota bacterium]|nr:alternative ribosome rescue aminoacyl-tRNA hydrolase ArfB [Gemmatimonadota bacterium]
MPVHTSPIPETEIEIRAIRGGGPGGQHVNTSATRAQVLWNLEASEVFTEHQKKLIRTKLASRLDTGGNIRIVAGERRSLLQNQRAAVERLQLLVAKALVTPKPRKRTRPSKASKEKRLAEKKKRSKTKQDRRKVGPED